MSADSNTPKPEEPVLRLERAAICLHAVERPAQPPHGVKLKYPKCPEVQSMELDLLAYRFQIDPPFGTRCEFGRQAVEIEFPKRFDYHSEGETTTLECRRGTRREAEVLVSSTTFLRSGFKVWHICFTPPEGGYFDEYDLIKLIHLYDGRTEQTNLAKKVKFRIRAPKPADATEEGAGIEPGPALKIRDFLREVCQRMDGNLELRAGTLQLVTGPTLAGTVNMNRLLTHITAARTAGKANYHRQMLAWLGDKTCVERRILMAFDGIVEGIFDFEEVDTEELLDTLEPTFFRSADFIRVHRSSLVNITAEDRPLSECWDTVGISPYLIIPHAVALHNEALVSIAEDILDRVTSDRRRQSVLRLENAVREAEFNLNRYFLPNVFNYVTERTLYERSRVDRGGEDQRLATEAKLQEVKSLVEQKWEVRQAHGQIVITAMLGVISLLQVQGQLFDVMGAGHSAEWKWSVLGVLSLLLVVVIIYLGRRGLRE